MTMGGLKKTDKRHEANSDDLDALGSGSALITNNENSTEKARGSKKPTKYKPFTFSLTETVSDDIDDLCLTARKINRSDVVKAGVKVLLNMPKAERKTLMEELK